MKQNKIKSFLNRYFKIGSIFLLTLSSIHCQAQKEGSVWYFGNKAGLDFKTNPPTVLSDGQLDTEEGCLTVADRITGQMLFYSDGSLVWGKNHQLMPSLPTGGLGGHFSSSQSGIVIPDPANPFQYYIFSVYEKANGPIYWAKVDVSANNGNGDVIASKNLLLDNPCEKIAAIGNCITNEYWVVGHKFESDSFYAWKVTSSGIAAPVITKIGSFITNANARIAALGYLKFSPNGKRLAAAHFSPVNTIEIFDFDQNTGTLSNPIIDTFSQSYGCSFSPNSKLLYASSRRRIIQYNVSLPTASQVIASRNTIGNVSQYGALQNAINGKMYHSGNATILSLGSAYLNTINKPNLYGAACDFQDSSQVLTPGLSLEGLPSIVENFLIGETKLEPPSNLSICPGGSIDYPILNEVRINGIIPSNTVSINADTSNLIFTPTNTTKYTIYYQSQGFCNYQDSIEFTIQVNAVIANFDITPSEITMANPVFNLVNQSQNATSYNWLENNLQFSTDINPSVLKTDTGTYCFKLIAQNTQACIDSITKCGIVENVDYGVFIPNAFSPNGDGINNTFRALYGRSIIFENMSIYNRWGNCIFQTTNPFEDWDGKFKGLECETGVYFYIFNYSKKGQPGRIIRKGDLHLIR